MKRSGKMFHKSAKDNQIIYYFPECYENNSTENDSTENDSVGMFDSVVQRM